MSAILNLDDELAYVASADFVLGQYIYLGQVKTGDGKTVVLSVAYKPDYAARKLLPYLYRTYGLDFDV